MTFPTLIKKLRKKLQQKRVRAFRRVVPIKAFVDNYTFITADGSAGVCLRLSGVDDECHADEDRESDSNDLRSAQKQFDDVDRLYQYAIRRADCPIIHREFYENLKIQEIQEDRHRHLRETAHFGSIELYAVKVSGMAARLYGVHLASSLPS